MRKQIFVVFLVLSFALTGYAQERQDSSRQRPKAVYRVDNTKVVVWENRRDDGTTWKNFQVEKFYQKDGEWKTSTSFNKTELIKLKAAIEKAISEECVEIEHPAESN